MLYNNFSSYLRKKYGGNVKKICVDGGFSCPNRDGVCGRGGCIYCGERGAGEHIDGLLSIGEQVETAISNMPKVDKFIVYFQNFTNTYADTKTLKERYDASLIDKKIVALSIGTRPDCITEEIADLIASYKSRVDVWVELGLQTASDRTAKVINRGYSCDVYEKAVQILKERDIPVVTHMIIGLPGENQEDVDRTVDFINKSGVWGVKIHSIYVMTGTKLAKMYLDGEYEPPTREEYIRLCARCIARLKKDMIIHRITGDCPKNMLVAPLWNKDKNGVINGIRAELQKNGWCQGSCYTDTCEI